MSVVTGLGIHVKVASIEASREFYEDYLRLTPVFVYGDPEFVGQFPKTVAKAPDVYRGVTYNITPETRLEIADGHIAVKDPAVFESQISSPKVSAMINVSSLVPLLRDSSRRPQSSVKHYYWDTLEMVMRDPDGWVVVLIAPYSEAEAEEISRYVSVEKVEPNIQ